MPVLERRRGREEYSRPLLLLSLKEEHNEAQRGPPSFSP